MIVYTTTMIQVSDEIVGRCLPHFDQRDFTSENWNAYPTATATVANNITIASASKLHCRCKVVVCSA